jgi:Protein of unknown function (DUF3499)
MVRPAVPVTLLAMERRPLCARPGCQGQTAAWLTYDYAERRVWLDDAPSDDLGDQWALCAGHATRLGVPKGWTRVDRRVAKPSRYEPPATLVS